MPSFFHGVPGVYTGQSLTPRNIFSAYSASLNKAVPTFQIIDGTYSRDTGNTPSTLLRAGNLLGKITSGGKYRPSIIGVTHAASLAAATSLTVNAAVATELARLIAVAAGNVSLKVVGPPTAAGTVASTTVACSAASGTTLTVGTTNTNEVQTVAVDTILSAGSIGITAIKNDGTEQNVLVAYNTSWTQTVADIQTALIAKLGTSAVACAVTATHDMTVTFSGAGYAGIPQPLLTVDISAATGPTKVSVTHTATGAGGLPALAAGSIIQPADGSQTPLTVLGNEFGVDVTDITGAALDQRLDFYWTGGDLLTGQLVNFLADDYGQAVDTSVQAYLKAQLNTTAGNDFSFDNSR